MTKPVLAGLSHEEILVYYAEWFGPESPRTYKAICGLSASLRKRFFDAWERQHGHESLEALKKGARDWWRIHVRAR